jgi:hypothetical protein
MISSVLPTIFNKGASGAKYKGQDNVTVDISSTAFVDDVNTHHSGDSPFNTLFENMQHKYIQWKKILEVSGGKLSDEISTFYALDWTFSNG